jgi:exopolyphosphatase/guanosine-5'-triphosphate,3'-diphosphate pyrophosphatase
MKINTFGAIDIGSNTIKLLISNAENIKTKQNFKGLAYLRVPIRLGSDVFHNGFISKEKEEELIIALKGFSYIFKAYNVEFYKAYATSAMREANNGIQIINSIKKECGVDVEIISDTKEADIIYEASSEKLIIDKKKSYLYIDVGGGSTKVIVYSGGEKICSQSFKLGTVRILSDAIELREIALFNFWLKDMTSLYSPSAIIASGGNINNIHKLLKNDNKSIEYCNLKNLHDTMQIMSIDERIKNFKLNYYRADVIVPAMYIFLMASRICKIKDFIVPKVELVDGMIYNLYNKHNI